MTLTQPPSDPTPSTPGVPAGWYNDPTTGRMRWWNGAAWTNDFAPAAPVYPGYQMAQPYGLVPASNGPAIAALVLGIVAFFITPIPFFIGLIFGGIPALLAVIFGIIGITRAAQTRSGLPMAIVGLCLGGFMLLLIPLGAGWIW